MDHQQLLHLAEAARENAYAPYSDFTVGAALLCQNGKVYTGCNVENASYGATNCAERTALFAAVAAGERDFLAIAVAGGKRGAKGGVCAPCGICRQVLAELCRKDLVIVLASEDGQGIQRHTLDELLPLSFTDAALEG